MKYLPRHGRITCNACFNGMPVLFNESRIENKDWRITANPLAWGNQTAEIIVLGFSKGPTQAGELTSTIHNEIAYKGGRLNVGKILGHIGLLEKTTPSEHKQQVDDIIADENGRFHFGSLIRCTVEQYHSKDRKWKGSGGGMLDKFVKTDFGSRIANNCTKMYLSELPPQTKLVVMFGMGSKGNYIKSAYELFQSARPGSWRRINDVAYTDGEITVVHVEHFASQGALIPQWLGERDHPRAALGKQAKAAVKQCFS